MAQSDVCLTGNQAVSGLITAESRNILSRRLLMKYFYGHFLPSTDSRRACTCQCLAKECAQVLVNCLEDYVSRPRKKHARFD